MTRCQKVRAPVNERTASTPMTSARPKSAQSMTRRRSTRSLSIPAGSRNAIVGRVIPMPRIESAAGAFHNAYASQAIATRKMPSPRSEIVIPAQRMRKSRCLSGASRLMREKPPGRSSASWLCCTACDLVDAEVEVFDQCVAAHRLGEQESLAELAAEFPKRTDLLGGLDSLGYDFEIEAVAHGDDGARQAGFLVLLRQERAVHLEDVDREA